MEIRITTNFEGLKRLSETLHKNFESDAPENIGVYLERVDGTLDATYFDVMLERTLALFVPAFKEQNIAVEVIPC